MIKRFFIVVCALVAISFSAAAQPKESSVREKIIELAKKYVDGKEVESFTFEKGSGLSVVKLALRKEMGKDFLKGIDIMIFISYDEAPAEMAEKVQKEVKEIAKDLISKDAPEDVTEGKKTLTYFDVDEETESIHDMIIIIEDEKTKMLMYMGGTIKAEDMKE